MRVGLAGRNLVIDSQHRDLGITYIAYPARLGRDALSRMCQRVVRLSGAGCSACRGYNKRRELLLVNDLVYLLQDPGRWRQSRPSRRAGADMLAMAAPDDWGYPGSRHGR
jgi:hypothetical protein